MLSPSELRSTFSSNPNLVITCAEIPCPEFSRFLYTSVGSNYYWIERLSWTYQRWLEYLDCPEIQTWVVYVSGTPASYIELEYNMNNNVKIVYFGLLPQFIGQHIGGHLLSFGVQQAWTAGVKRVWVHTCSLDHRYGLANYQARGFKLYSW